MNAGLLAVRILGASDPALQQKVRSGCIQLTAITYTEVFV
jgi:phosphoribosylcarboxyaminoimidazole (NCAIR) mutase